MDKLKNSPIKNEMGAVFIHVKDLKKSVDWYGRILGVEVDLKQVESPVYNMPINGTTGLTLDDHTFDKSFKHEPSPNPIVNFMVDDIDEAYEFIKENGVNIVREIERVGENFAWFNFSDPDGNVIMACTG
ncbi:VOC family protein [Oceanobacillus damuensis]|uniref:VOC family protein n=1 Tax=Oceanobacillus damuensis TaxID=937928 RepID=UPI000B0887FD|nr:VOC family protein [Oceanobacillus damuensis]